MFFSPEGESRRVGVSKQMRCDVLASPKFSLCRSTTELEDEFEYPRKPRLFWVRHGHYRGLTYSCQNSNSCKLLTASEMLPVTMGVRLRLKNENDCWTDEEEASRKSSARWFVSRSSQSFPNRTRARTRARPRIRIHLGWSGNIKEREPSQTGLNLVPFTSDLSLCLRAQA